MEWSFGLFLFSIGLLAGIFFGFLAGLGVKMYVLDTAYKHIVSARDLKGTRRRASKKEGKNA